MGARSLRITILAASFLLATVAHSAIITVNTTEECGGVCEQRPGDDDPTTCTLGEAIIAANLDQAVDGCPAGSGHDTIVLQSGATYSVYTPTLTTPLQGSNAFPAITSPITIANFDPAQGLSANHPRSIIRRESISIPMRFFLITTGSLDLQGIELTNGSQTAFDGGALWIDEGQVELFNTVLRNNEAANGGAIANLSEGTLGISYSHIYSNSGQKGGAIYNQGGALDIRKSFVGANEASLEGGDLYLGYGASGNSPVLLENSTFGNGNALRGGSLFLENGAVATANFITISGAFAGDAFGGGGIYLQAAGPNPLPRLDFQNSILARNQSGLLSPQPDDCVGEINDSYSLIGTENAGLCEVSRHSGSLYGVDPELTLADISSDEFVALPSGTSPIIDAADPNNCPSQDQLDHERFFGNNCDMGAVEVHHDLDDDGVPDEWDNCVFDPNPNQEDTNGDGFGDACQPGSDCEGQDPDDGNICTEDICDPNTGQILHNPLFCKDDGNICNGSEYCSATSGGCISGPPLDCSDTDPCTEDSCVSGTGCTHAPGPNFDGDAQCDALDTDDDNDGLLDVQELIHGADPRNPDTDGDGLNDREEVLVYLTSPSSPDTDHDGLTDAAEVLIHNSHPLVPDTDDDGLNDAQEVGQGTNPRNHDTDGDGLRDGQEVLHGASPTNPDTDGDGLNDGDEVNDFNTRPDQADTDHDGLTDSQEVNGVGNPPYTSHPLDPDSDDDGLNDYQESLYGTNPLDSDTDDDGLNDAQEVGQGTNPRNHDTDGDGLRDGQEVLHGASPTNPDTDGDGLNDGDEVNDFNTRPDQADTDHDGLTDSQEVNGVGNPPYTSHPLDPDSDDDGLNDYQESLYGTNPQDPDTDDDGLSDAQEVGQGTNPRNHDTDGDGLRDGQEVLHGASPINPDTDGDGLNDGDEVNDFNTRPDQADTDHDGLTDSQEVNGVGNPPYTSHPLDPDSDDDGLNDGSESVSHTNPLDVDTDNDGLSDYVEVVKKGTNPLSRDTDGDGLCDGHKPLSGCHSEDQDNDGDLDPGESDPLLIDTDNDGIVDPVELGYTQPEVLGAPYFQPDSDPTSTTRPDLADTDGDGALDGEEDANGNGSVDPGESNPQNSSDGMSCSLDFSTLPAGTCSGMTVVRTMQELQAWLANPASNVNILKHKNGGRYDLGHQNFNVATPCRIEINPQAEFMNASEVSITASEIVLRNDISGAGTLRLRAGRSIEVRPASTAGTSVVAESPIVIYRGDVSSSSSRVALCGRHVEMKAASQMNASKVLMKSSDQLVLRGDLHITGDARFESAGSIHLYPNHWFDVAGLCELDGPLAAGSSPIKGHCTPGLVP